MTAPRRLLAGMLALSLPITAVAQAAPASSPATQAAETIKLTPYGFILGNGYSTGGSLAARDYPGQAVATPQGGSVLFSARQSRFGVRLAAREDWSGADLTGVLEIDFVGGQLSGTAVNSAAPSTAWTNALLRLRVASMTAAWSTEVGRISVLAGQDFGLVNPLFAESLAWVALPLFWQSGNLWRRSPQFRAGWASTFGAFDLKAEVAVLSPATADAPVDLGSGNQSRRPNIEARIGGTARFGQELTAALGVGYHANTRRLSYGTPDQQDVDGNVLGIDLDVGLTKYAQVKGEYYTGKGADDGYNAISAPIFGAPGAVQALESSGYWAQLIAKPFAWGWLTFGGGHAGADKAGSAAGARIGNDQVAAGLIFNAGKSWRFGLEYAQVTTEYRGATATAATTSERATQVGISSMFRF